MPVLLFELRNVPEDEAEEVRALLNSHTIDFYETSAGNWGISMPAIWLPNAEKLHLAQKLLAEYQRQRYITQRQQYLQRKQNRETPTFISTQLKNPLRFMVYTLSALLILYLSSQLITELGRQPKPSTLNNPPPPKF